MVLSNTEWIKTDTSFEPGYHIKCHSSNGITLETDGVVAIDYKSDDEGIVRPSIVHLIITGHILLLSYGYKFYALIRKHLIELDVLLL